MGAVREDAMGAEAKAAIEAQDILLVLLDSLVVGARAKELLRKQLLQPTRHSRVGTHFCSQTELRAIVV